MKKTRKKTTVLPEIRTAPPTQHLTINVMEGATVYLPDGCSVGTINVAADGHVGSKPPVPTPPMKADLELNFKLDYLVGHGWHIWSSGYYLHKDGHWHGSCSPEGFWQEKFCALSILASAENPPK